MKKLKNILLATTFGLSFGQGYSQTKEYYTGNPNDPKSEIKKIDEKTYNEMLKKGWSNLAGVWENNYSTHKQYIVPENGNNLLKTTKKEWNNAYDKNSNTQNKPSTNYNYFTPKTNKSKANLGNVLNTTQDALNIALVIGETAVILDALLKPRQKNYISPVQPIGNSPAQPIYESPSESSWDWQDKKPEESSLEKKSGVIKRVDEDFWGEIKDRKLESKKIANERSKELSDFVEKQIEYSPETKKKLEEEAKISDEYFKEIGMNPGAQVKYKVVGTAEIGPNGELIKKDSYSPEREITDEEKVILYYAYKAMKKDPLTGSVMEGVEIMNNPEKVDEFFKEKGMNPGAQVKYKVVGTAEIGPNGELIKKDSYSPARELTPEEKVILYYAYNLSKNYTSAGPVIKGVETINKLEKEVDFLFTKPIGDNTYSYFKLAGKEDYFVMKNSPYGDAIINLADFKEKTEKSTTWWDK